MVVPGVTLSLTCAGLEPRREVSNELGQFRFADVQAGACSIVAELQGFTSAVKTVAVKAGEMAAVALPRDYQGNLASADFGGFSNGVGRTFRGKWVFEF